MRKIGICLISFLIITSALVLSRNAPVKPKLDIPLPNNPISTTIEDALSSIDGSELRNTLVWLASPELGGRMPGQKGNEAAKDFLVQYYGNLGLKVDTQEFAVKKTNDPNNQSTGKTSNVIAMLEGNDPQLKDETVVIGAHFDHIGVGPSMSRTPQRRKIHPGADDNASGTTALLGAAKALARMRGQNKRRIVFISFSAEEMGLIGSKYYVQNPLYPNMVFMLNMDMVGRYKSNNKLEAIGAVSSSDVKKVLNKLNTYPFRPSITSDSGGGSDHAPFYQRGVPVCFLHTGLHSDYHTPDDTADKIDYDGLTLISKYAANVVWEVSQLLVKPNFQGGRELVVSVDSRENYGAADRRVTFSIKMPENTSLKIGDQQMNVTRNPLIVYSPPLDDNRSCYYDFEFETRKDGQVFKINRKIEVIAGGYYDISVDLLDFSRSVEFNDHNFGK